MDRQITEQIKVNKILHTKLMTKQHEPIEKPVRCNVSTGGLIGSSTSNF